ncbi:MAG: hypothetical protein ACI4MH_02680 [Candidatus Coproplasma sp.]
MIVKAKYFGFYPLGSDVDVNGVHIMQREWKIVSGSAFVIGSKKISNGEKVSAVGRKIYSVEENGKTVFFTAKEYGMGKYHIFLFSDRVNNKLSNRSKSIAINFYTAVVINKVDSSVKVYGKYVSPGDMNGLIPDSFFKYVKEEKDGEDSVFYFTNTGIDEHRLFVKNPKSMERTENYIIIGKAEKVRWESKYNTKEEAHLYTADYLVENNLVKRQEFIDGKLINECVIGFA